jgi:BirA family biotin operon repressor/biotin-[acetyl-CoA-carboxylase] ligase
MAEARRVASDLTRPTWIFARRQTAARGRRGRVWENPDGNFSATLVMRPGGGPGAAALRSFSAANAVFEALAMHANRSALALKWPNDVLLNGGKVAGILLESTGSAGAIDWLSIGIGVNLIRSPRGMENSAFAPVSLLEETGSRVEAIEFLGTLADCFATQEAIFQRLGFQQIRESWLENAARLGEIITARTGREEITGKFETVDEAGQLVLSTSRGMVRIPAADVYF